MGVAKFGRDGGDLDCFKIWCEKEVGLRRPLISATLRINMVRRVYNLLTSSEPRVAQNLSGHAMVNF